MTEHLTQRLVDHRNVGLASQAVTEFTLHHGERRFDIGTLVVVGKKVGALELEVVIHLFPRSPAIAAMMRRKRDVRNGSHAGDRIGIAATCVTFIGGNFGNREVMGRCFAKRRQQGGIVGVAVLNLYGGNDVGFHSAHEMTLNPIMLRDDFSVFVVIPARKPRSGKAGRIHGEVNLDRLEGQAALSNQRLKNRSKVWILKVIGNAIEVWNLGDESATVSLSQIAHKAALRNRGIHLESDTENSVGKWQWRSARSWRNRDKARTQVAQQHLELVLFVSLRFIVSRPVLWIGNALRGGDSHALSNRRTTVRVLLTPHDECSGKNVLAPAAARFVIGARAFWMPMRDMFDSVESLSVLGRDNPASTVTANSSCGC